MDVSLLVSLLLGLPAAILATLRIIDLWKKQRANKTKALEVEQNATSQVTPVDQVLVPIIRQVEMAADIESEIVEELRQYEAAHRR